jgi:hypothetical protein
MGWTYSLVCAWTASTSRFSILCGVTLITPLPIAGELERRSSRVGTPRSRSPSRRGGRHPPISVPFPTRGSAPPDLVPTFIEA